MNLNLNLRDLRIQSLTSQTNVHGIRTDWEMIRAQSQIVTFLHCTSIHCIKLNIGIMRLVNRMVLRPYNNFNVHGILRKIFLPIAQK